jgi:D-psicose/D-tagatose/L-ribulose 3-epimerase
VDLAIEPLNRFETDLVNTVEQGLDLCERVGLDNVGLLLDTFHMNIEEKSIPDAIRQAGSRIRHFHACENDRGAPGSGHVDWQPVLTAVRDSGYQGQVVIESFTPEIQEIARAVSTWRPVAASGDDLARDGLAFLKAQLG